ncbi:MAG TPA: hypothetical protein VNT81_10955 [Vicinamibacterales bacterium]|nr:hypothetical protein [Vicinamibacterales bacterium]
MFTTRFVTVTMATAVVTASLVLTHDSLSTIALAKVDQVKSPPGGVLAEPVVNSGGPIYAAFEGQGPLKDGRTVLLLGYFNRNRTQLVDIPIGPDNSIEPGGPDYGQPTHFLPGRQHGMFAIVLPKDFGTKRLSWTINANGHKNVVTFWANPQYYIDFYKNTANGNEPPRIKFAMDGSEYIGPPRERTVATLSATVGQPLDLTAWAADQPATITFESGAEPPAPAPAPATRKPANEPPPAFIGGRVVSVAPPAAGGAAAAAAAARRGDIQVIWKKYRGPGDVKIGTETISLVTGGDPKKYVEAKTTAMFSAPGTYWLRAQVNDASGNGGGGDQCCWTSAHIVVNVK